MGVCEIKYVDCELENNKGNLQNLNANWCETPKPIACPSEKSRGNAAKGINDNCKLAVQGSVSLGRLLANSLGFFNAMQITYTEADEKCADAIKKEGSKYNTEEGLAKKTRKPTKKDKKSVKKKTNKKSTKRKKIKGSDKDPWKDKDFESQRKKRNEKMRKK